MDSNQVQPEDALHLERFLNILETPFSRVCQVLGLNGTEPRSFLEVDNCIFLFDSQKNLIFSGAVIIGQAYGFYGIQVGANWLESAEKLESQGLVTASALERFTKPGPDFSISVYLYPDDCPDTSASKVRDYSVNARYGRGL